MISVEEKTHHILQSHGARYCPFNPGMDSDSLPPLCDESCSEKKVHGYTLHEQNGNLCVLYNTRCLCSLNIPFLYQKDAHKSLTAWLLLLRQEFRMAHLDYTEEGRAYINLEVTAKTQTEDNRLYYPLYSPYMSYSFHPIKEREKETK